jgi:hypothetical protein
MQPGYRPDGGLVARCGQCRLVVHTDVQSMLLTRRRKGVQTVGVVLEWPRHHCIIHWRLRGRSQ